MSESPTSPEAPERWLPVADWEDLYEISNLGHVRGLFRMVTIHDRRNGSYTRPRGGAVLKPWLSTHGYETVRLCRGRYHEHWTVHQLVAAAFIGPCPAGMEVRHGPNGPLDNRASQLRYGSHQENLGPDRARDGTTIRGEQHVGAKLTEAIVAECKRRYAAGERQTALASEFGVSRRAISKAISGENWHHCQPSANLVPGAPAGSMPPLPFGIVPESA